jgi:two-component system, NtrC family, sensor kinase
MRHLRLNLQSRVIVLMVGGMVLILGLSIYLHGIVTRRLIEEDRYSMAVTQTVALAARIAAADSLSNPDALRQDIQLVAEARKDFEQIDIAAGDAGAPRLIATTVPAAARLPALDDRTPDNDLHEMEHPAPDVVTMEVGRHDVRYWLISVAMRQRDSTGFVTALVLKDTYDPLVSSLQSGHDQVLAGVIVVCAALFVVLFAHFFQKPARDIVHAMETASSGDFDARVSVHRHDELGRIARGFNSMMDELSARDRERETLLSRIRGFNTELHAEVDRATAELRTLNEELLNTQQRLERSALLAATGQVAASIAHEIGTPLNSISGHLHLLIRRHASDPDTQRRVGIIHQQLDTIVASVRAILGRTRPRRSPPRPLDLASLIGEVLRLVGPTLDGHRIALATLMPPALPLALADRDSLHQVFLNLINNSIDAMPSGGRLTIEAIAGRDSIEISVRDTGCGMAAEALEHLFEPMWTTKATGSGFGLAIAREILDEHGGRIAIRSAEGGGADVRLWVPLVPISAVATA